MSAAYIQVHFRRDFFKEANYVNPDHTAPLEQSDLSAYSLQYRLLIMKTRGVDNKSRDWLQKG